MRRLLLGGGEMLSYVPTNSSSACGYHVIDSSGNPARSHKYYMIGIAVGSAITQGYDHAVAGTCGALGLSLALVARPKGMRVTACIPETYSGRTVNALSACGAEVIRCGKTYEEAAFLAVRHGWADFNPSGPFNGLLVAGWTSYVTGELARLSGSGADALEIERVWVPAGNGANALGVVIALEKLGVGASVVGVTSAGNNALVASRAAGRIVTLAPGSLNETEINEPLCNWRPSHAAELCALSEGVFSVIGVHDCELVDASEELSAALGFHVTPAGASGLAGLMRGESRDSPGNVVVVTSRSELDAIRDSFSFSGGRISRRPHLPEAV
jgi:threonine dehydratase